MAETIGTAYIQIEPSFEGGVNKIEKEMGGEGEKSGKSFSEGFGKVLGGAGKVAASALAIGTAAVGKFTQEAVSAFSQYEQLVGGVETLFGDEVGATIEANAQKAFATAGLSANQYMDTVTSFSASLIQSLGGDQAAAAEVADRAIIDMADNANKMGTSMESIQNAYSGFAKGNFTMLDNLKLGYGGTGEEMKRLIEDASKMTDIQEKLGITVDKGDTSFANIANAISVVQANLGIAGATAAEASTTIEGSINSLKGAWANLTTAIGAGEDLGPYIDNLVETALTALDNLMPTIQRALEGIGDLVVGLAPIISEQLPILMDALLPNLLTAATALVSGVVTAIPTIIQALVSALPSVVETICQTLISNLPMIIDAALQLIITLASGIAQALPDLIPQIVEVVLTIVDTLLNNIDMLVDVAIEFIMAFAEGIITATPRLIEKAPEIIIKLVEAIIENLPKVLEAAVELILMLVKGIVDSFGKLLEVGAQIVDNVKNGFSKKVEDAKNWGRDMIQNFINGILEKWNDLKASVSKVAQSVKDFLGFSEPDKGPLSNFHTYAPDMMQLFASGIKQNSSLVTDALNGVGASVMNTGFNVNGIASIGGTIDANVSSNNALGVIEGLLVQLIDASSRNIVLDTGALVGGTVGAYNQALGQISTRSARR